VEGDREMRERGKEREIGGEIEGKKEWGRDGEGGREK
jgi:hypothetical protein